MRRYALVIDMYLIEDNDVKAIKEAEKIAFELCEKYDNQAKIIMLDEVPFGKLTRRKII